MKGWKKDKKWSDQFLTEIGGLLGRSLFREPPIIRDQKEATDLIIMGMGSVAVACRIRKHTFLKRYGDQFTIRTARPQGTKTELTKIIEGWGDFIFYGFANEDCSGLSAWLIGDLKVFRLWFMRHMARNNGAMPGAGQHNHDGSSDFMAFRIADLPVEFIIAQKPATVLF